MNNINQIIANSIMHHTKSINEQLGYEELGIDQSKKGDNMSDEGRTKLINLISDAMLIQSEVRTICDQVSQKAGNVFPPGKQSLIEESSSGDVKATTILKLLEGTEKANDLANVLETALNNYDRWRNENENK